MNSCAKPRKRSDAMRRSVLYWIGALCLCLSLTAGAEGKDLPPPQDYGVTIMGAPGEQRVLPAVRFDHWLHRAFYTCRLCHVDLGFAMTRNGTGVKADMNAQGLYCGACHDGQRVHGNRAIFAACRTSIRPEAAAECNRCHSVGIPVKRMYDYDSFTRKLPKQKTGLVDWEKAEEQGFIRPSDILRGVSVVRPRMIPQGDFIINSRGLWMTDIIFSHKKHADWNGCEVCHPDIFPSVKKGTVRYSMFQIAEGEYCGLCHDRVAFPLVDCQKCHVKSTPHPGKGVEGAASRP